MKTYHLKICHKSFLLKEFRGESTDLALAVFRWCFIYRQNKRNMSLSYQSLFCKLKRCKWSMTLKNFFFTLLKHNRESCASSLSFQKNYSNWNPHPQNLFFSLFFFAWDNNLSNQSFDSPPKSPFKDFPRGRIGEWTEAWLEEKETDLDNSFVHVYFLWKGKMTPFLSNGPMCGLLTLFIYLHYAPITLSNYFNVLRTRDQDIYLFYITHSSIMGLKT